MPLDDLQKAILAILLKHRSPDSVFAGGSVLHRHGHRLSSDQDIFHSADADVIAIAAKDLDDLRLHGFTAEMSRQYEGLCEAMVGNEQQGFTRIQWVQAGSWAFYEPVPDPDYGWRLHMADLAVNKVLAAGGRREVRDYVDLVLIHRHIMPLWHAIWAAPGKDEAWSPGSLIEKIAMTNAFRQRDIDDDIMSTVPLSASETGSTIRDALNEARDIVARLPAPTAGCLFIDASGHPVHDVQAILSGGGVTPLQPRHGGAWPSGPDIDHLLIRRVIDTYGWEGSANTPLEAPDRDAEGGEPSA
jgi:hypothetical protein